MTGNMLKLVKSLWVNLFSAGFSRLKPVCRPLRPDKLTEMRLTEIGAKFKTSYFLSRRPVCQLERVQL